MLDAPSAPPILAVPPRPPGQLSVWKLLKTAASDTLSICDQEVFERLVLVRRYGPVRIAFVSDPAGIRRVLVENAANYPRLPAIRRLYEAEIGTGTLATEGPLWRRHRKVAAASVDRRAIDPHVPELLASADALAEAVGNGGAAPLNIEACVAGIWLNLLNQVSTGGDARGLPILAWLSKVPRKPRALDLVPMPPWLKERVSPARQSPERVSLRATLLEMVEDRRRPDYAGPRDLVWRVAHGLDTEGERLSAPESRDEAASVIAAGDASIRMLTWIWYLLALHPEVEARLHAELDGVLGGGPMQPAHFRALPYLRQVMDEAMRLYPPIPMLVRQARRGDEVCGLRIPRGTIVIVAPWVVHRHRRLWDNPDVFDPGRFAEGQGLNRPKLQFLPFSAGPRVCSGAHYASVQMTAIIVALARRFRFRLAPGKPVVPFGGISLHPRGGLWVTAERRR